MELINGVFMIILSGLLISAIIDYRSSKRLFDEMTHVYKERERDIKEKN